MQFLINEKSNPIEGAHAFKCVPAQKFPFNSIGKIIFPIVFVLLVFYMSPAWSRVTNLDCDTVPLGKIVQAPVQLYDSYPRMGYYALGIGPSNPPPKPVPSNYYLAYQFWCGIPWTNLLTIYATNIGLEPQGNTNNYPGTSIPINEISDETCKVGNPCSVGSGAKQQEEVDYVGIGPQPMSLKRIYRSTYLVPPTDGFSSAWMHEWQRRLDFSKYNSATPRLMALRGDGTSTSFASANGIWTAVDGRGDQIVAVSDIGGTGNGFRLEDRRNNRTEDYDAAGRLMLVKERNGWTTSLKYSDSSTPKSVSPYANLLIEIRNSFGRTIQFTYDTTGRISAATLPDGTVVRYDYNGLNVLSVVTYADNTQRKYQYDNRFLWALTGITDEKGVRFATYTYDSLGRVASTEHAGGVDKFQLSFLGNGQTSVTTADGTSRTFTSELQGNVLRPTGASAPCPACGDIAKSVSYDAAGNVASKTDFANKETRFTYDALGRETQRIEGYGTTDVKTTTTEWHPTWNLPLKIAAPGQMDYFTYDTQGQMTAHGWFPTADANGSQGLNAAPASAMSGNSYSYDANGLMTTLTEVEDSAITKQWSFTYDAQGNLLTVTDGARTAQALAYDPAGRLLEAVNIDGDTLKYVYDSRGRVTQYVFGENLTAYVYDAIGQKIQVTSPYGDVTNYVYDAAHRLIDVLYNGESLTTPEAPETAAMTMARSESGADNAGANPFAAWFGWLTNLFKWLLPSAHAQGVPAPSPPIYGGGGSAPGTYTPNPLQDLVPGLSGEKTPGQWLAMATQRVIDYCRSKVKEQIHQGKINAQGAGYRDPGVGDAEKWGPQLNPPTVEWGLGALERLEARMSRTQLRTRNQAIKDAKRYVVSTGRAGGLDAVRKRSFYNDEIRKENEDGGRRDERVDVDILSGKAFVP